MDWTFLFFSLDGRINRAKYWIGSLLIGAAGIVAMLLIVWAVGLSDAAVKLAIAVALALMYPTYAVMAKRFQDRNRPGTLALFGIVPLILSNLLYTFGIFDPANPTTLSQIFDLALVGISIWLLIDLGILKGTQGPNRYGADPLGRQAADAPLA
jgi:uncharacterized membrane protein YhaH (DUF805 family)